MDTDSKIKSFTDLNSWKEAHKLVLMVYELTKMFPKEENFRLVDQLCRAVVSITSNIAEGFSRNSIKEKTQLTIARDLKYISMEKFQQASVKIVTVNKLIHGLMKSAKSR